MVGPVQRVEVVLPIPVLMVCGVQLVLHHLVLKQVLPLSWQKFRGTWQVFEYSLGNMVFSRLRMKIRSRRSRHIFMNASLTGLKLWHPIPSPPLVEHPIRLPRDLFHVGDNSCHWLMVWVTVLPPSSRPLFMWKLLHNLNVGHRHTVVFVNWPSDLRSPVNFSSH